ncbi:intradiol ring-cleavage dioxygenase [Bradyrhizobium sp. dw_411]|uniref:dioxygenase family protein n=1 Tax=Bradyrhizobium sp. dw_411 TaxID=2720082 RepID=UPI001BCC2976
MTNYQSRRRVLEAGVFGLGSLLVPSRSFAESQPSITPECRDSDMAATPRETEGPFFKPSSPANADLYEVGIAGRLFELSGFVLSRDCKPVSRALLDFWQANDTGDYDSSGFRLRGHQFTDAGGRYRLRSIVPGAYERRTRHIHVKVQPPGGRLLTTQLYFPGEPKNGSDGFFRSELLMRTASNNAALTGRFDFVLDVR